MNELTTIDMFRKSLGAGHRSNQFKVVVTIPTSYIYGDAQKNMEFICFATSIPAQQLGSIDMNFRGLVAHYAGDPTPTDAWTVSCYNPTSFNLRKSFIAWKRAYQQEGTTSGKDEIDLSTADVYLMTKNNKYVYQTTLYNVWPSDIGQVEVSWENQNQISRFDTQFRYDYAIENLDLSSEEAGNTTTTNG